MDSRRSQRVTEALREELSELISYELSDPRASSVTVTDVLLSADRKKAQVLVSVEGGELARAEAIAALEHATPYLKRQLGHRLTLFRVPDLQFQADLLSTLEGRLPAILKRIKKGRPRESGPEKVSPE